MTDKMSLDALLAHAARNPVALAELAGILLAKDEGARARAAAAQALQLSPDDPKVRVLATHVLSQNVHGWHFGIVRDAARNAAYEAALRRAVTPGVRVLEIGTGSGILAMMAARAGAADVVTCEMRPVIADAARDIVARNGYGGRVRVLSKKSFDVDAEADMGGRADIYVSEIVSNTIVGEGALPAVEHAVTHLLKPGARIIPARGIVRVALGYDAEIAREQMGEAEGFDLSPFNRLAKPSYHIKREDPRLSLTSAPADLFDFDFQSGGPFPEGTASVVLASSGGPVNGVAQWIALQMDEQSRYENDPKPGETSCWAVIFWPFARVLTLEPGAKVTVRGRHDRRQILVWSETP